MPTALDVSRLLSISVEAGVQLMKFADRLYTERMAARFTNDRLNERLKRTNPFLLRIRGVSTVRQWAEYQVQSALIASEEEAVGHLLEQIAKLCHPAATTPRFTDDFDFDVVGAGTVRSFQVKMSWDCMPMSSRRNLSNTIRRVSEFYAAEGIEFTGYFAPCYGRGATKRSPGQTYVSLASRNVSTRMRPPARETSQSVMRPCPFGGRGRG